MRGKNGLPLCTIKYNGIRVIFNARAQREWRDRVAAGVFLTAS
jgi:hypothetical protein